jgi:hypothetical protein
MRPASERHLRCLLTAGRPTGSCSAIFPTGCGPLASSSMIRRRTGSPRASNAASAGWLLIRDRYSTVTDCSSARPRAGAAPNDGSGAPFAVLAMRSRLHPAWPPGSLEPFAWFVDAPGGAAGRDRRRGPRAQPNYFSTRPSPFDECVCPPLRSGLSSKKRSGLGGLEGAGRGWGRSASVGKKNSGKSVGGPG